ncbi:hypothetical protein HWV62_26759 [Athelia sp. TMB]|nr:hypothetical protein HWV62_26759 [Athelia sp. TMB]
MQWRVFSLAIPSRVLPLPPSQAPALWNLLDSLLCADARAVERRIVGGKAAAKRVERVLGGRKAVDLDGDELMAAVAGEAEEGEGAESEDEYWQDMVLLMEAPSSAELIAERNRKLLSNKKVLCLSVLLQNTDHRCNTFQSIVGLFLQSAGAPETIVEPLSRLGVLLTTSSINNMVKNLSVESTVEMKALGHTLLASYAYDNVDIDLKHATPTGDALHDTLIHLTSATMIKIDHGITPEMLACSEMLWRQCKHSPKANLSDVPAMTSYIHLLDIHPEDEHPSGLTRRKRFRVWRAHPKSPRDMLGGGNTLATFSVCHICHGAISTQNGVCRRDMEDMDAATEGEGEGGSQAGEPK